MQGTKWVAAGVAAVVVAIAAASGIVALKFQRNADALWQIVSQQCVPGQRLNNQPAPCRLVNLPDDYVVLKDRNGPLQFLLLPVAKVSGIESQKLLNPATANYFAEAWRARHFMEERRGAPIDESVYALAINSRWGRSQNQLHIHISCLRADVRQRLDSLSGQLSNQWQTHQLANHDYQLRVISRDEFKRTSPFILIARELPGAREEMGSYGITVASLGGGKRVLMVLKRNWLLLNRGHAEELQDHSCALLSRVNPHTSNVPLPNPRTSEPQASILPAAEHQASEALASEPLASEALAPGALAPEPLAPEALAPEPLTSEPLVSEPQAAR